MGGEEREAGAGSLLVFSRFEEHSVRVLTHEYRRFTLLISPEVVLGSDNYILSSVLINRGDGFDRVIDLKKDILGGIEITEAQRTAAREMIAEGEEYS